MMSYYELVTLLDKMIESPVSDEYINALNNANVSLTKDRYLRFIEQVNYLLTKRLRNAMNKVIDLVCERYIEPNELVLELNNIRNEISYMQKVVTCNLVKKDNQEIFLKSIIKNNNEIFTEIRSLYTDEEFFLVIDGYFIKEN